jgi:NTE family protein
MSGTSAGALNAAALKAGLVAGGRGAARKRLPRCGNRWATSAISAWCPGCSPSCRRCGSGRRRAASSCRSARRASLAQVFALHAGNIVDQSAGCRWFAISTSARSATMHGPALFVGATNVRTGKVKVFSGQEITARRFWPRPACPRCSRRSRSTARPIGTAAFPATPRCWPLYEPRAAGRYPDRAGQPDAARRHSRTPRWRSRTGSTRSASTPR